MEHRWRSRRKAQLDVVLYHREASIAIGCSRNVSVDGIFVEANPAGLDAGKVVELGFTLHERGRARRHRVKGMIVHRTGHGVGVLFTSRDPSVERTLDAIVNGSEGERDAAHRRLSLYAPL